MCLLCPISHIVFFHCIELAVFNRKCSGLSMKNSMQNVVLSSTSLLPLLPALPRHLCKDSKLKREISQPKKIAAFTLNYLFMASNDLKLHAIIISGHISFQCSINKTRPHCWVHIHYINTNYWKEYTECIPTLLLSNVDCSNFSHVIPQRVQCKKVQ